MLSRGLGGLPEPPAVPKSPLVDFFFCPSPLEPPQRLWAQLDVLSKATPAERVLSAVRQRMRTSGPAPATKGSAARHTGHGTQVAPFAASVALYPFKQ